MKDYVPLMQTGLWALLVLVVLLALRPELKNRVRSGGAIRFGPLELGEIRTEIDGIRSEVHNLNDRVALLFLQAMSSTMYDNLRKLASGRFGHFEMSRGLDTEIRHLRTMGYVRVHSVAAIPASGDDLSRYVEITAAGQQFVELREALTRERSRPDDPL